MYYVRIEKQVEHDLNDIIKYTHIYKTTCLVV